MYINFKGIYILGGGARFISRIPREQSLRTFKNKCRVGVRLVHIFPDSRSVDREVSKVPSLSYLCVSPQIKMMCRRKIARIYTYNILRRYRFVRPALRRSRLKPYTLSCIKYHIEYWHVVGRYRITSLFIFLIHSNKFSITIIHS